MSEAWDITTGDEREEDQVAIFIIFCEDQNDEPFYFRSFQIENKLKINCIPNQRKAKLNLVSALSYCVENGLIECEDHEMQVKENILENIWCVYDRDLEHQDLDQIKTVDDLNFTTAIQTASKAGLNIAWSNDAFELWVLLHFEPVPSNPKLHRDYIYKRLTEIFKVMPDIASEFESSIQSGKFDYQVHLKRRQSFLIHVLPLLKEKISAAIENAETLEHSFGAATPYHDCNPCTRVHLLVKELILARE